MDGFACIPNSTPAARAKLREGLDDCVSFIASAPCLLFCRMLGCASIALARLRADWKRKARSVAVRALQCLRRLAKRVSAAIAVSATVYGNVAPDSVKEEYWAFLAELVQPVVDLLSRLLQ